MAETINCHARPRHKSSWFYGPSPTALFLSALAQRAVPHEPVVLVVAGLKGNELRRYLFRVTGAIRIAFFLGGRPFVEHGIRTFEDVSRLKLFGDVAVHLLSRFLPHIPYVCFGHLQAGFQDDHCAATAIGRAVVKIIQFTFRIGVLHLAHKFGTYA